jgi:hypothetical protein
LGALIVVDAKVLAQQTALYGHAVVPAPRHRDLVNEVDNNQAHQGTDGRKVKVFQNRAAAGGIRPIWRGNVKKHLVQRLAPCLDPNAHDLVTAGRP